MVKSSLDLLATNKNYKKGFLAGVLAGKKMYKHHLKGGFDFKRGLAILAGPLGWMYLHNKDKQKTQKTSSDEPEYDAMAEIFEQDPVKPLKPVKPKPVRPVRPVNPHKPVKKPSSPPPRAFDFGDVELDFD